MFRRIEIIHDPDQQEWQDFWDLVKKHPDWDTDDDYPVHWKRGMGSCCYCYDEAVMDIWINKLKAPNLHGNFRFFFTERGWKEIGSDCASMLRKTGTRLRVLTIKEKSVDVFYQDKYQVATRPRKRNSRKGNRNEK
ncbi:MAG: hypothetical protein UT24_C0030G0007 [Candidatus Woesebacteria bacterium GW2011_GWB1_39_12]|uniref:Uncharacterized protein n=1 Tax=Candidatus Woesebacteria bacterium GW2011_GWB1_39_12 TaxID=1618574 RepID=A0A0G0PLB6_9BACT|nr:MAG: hypothetical protein UT24_C0030G0007 [Candidatus Woesebacteria bacterium GW2011_GWB1_39_12]